MKKFLYTAAGLGLCLLGLYYALYYRGFYIDFHQDAPVDVNVRTEGEKILIRDEKGNFVPYTIRGVELPSSIAGHAGTDYAIDEETWLRWFSMIQDMGANTIRISTIYDDSFYNAFYRFNKEQKHPLYLLQGLQVSDYANNSRHDAYGPGFYEELKKDSRDAVDVLHGRKTITMNKVKGSGNYRKDVSRWVLGYVVGNEWGMGTVAYTDHNKKNPDSYTGEYITASKEASAFEIMLAGILDEIVSYESKKYKEQKLVSFQNAPESDPFVYEEVYAKQLGKFNRLDAEHIRPGKELKSGYFAAYRVYEFCPGFASYFSDKQKKILGEKLAGLDQAYYQGYPRLLNRYHTVPVVITSYGFSSSRGTDSEKGPLTEEEQGRRLLEVYEDIVAAGCAGACISSWQDVWERRSWNTSYALDVTVLNRWHDIQTDGQGYGLLSFDPGEEKSVCYVDGERSEWEQEDRFFADDGVAMSARYDARCLYLLVEGVGERDEITIAVDSTPRSGSAVWEEKGQNFERDADFLLYLHGRYDTRLLVHSRYEALRENFLMETAGEDPFVFWPDKDAGDFVPIRMILKKYKLVPENATEEELKAAKPFDTFETGRLIYGNNNPESRAYNSLADFCFGEGFAEIRIPWQMLNFSNPSDMEIHDDYYENYGVEWFPAKTIYLGAAFGGSSQPVAMSPLSLKGWGSDVKYHERLKRSYWMIKESWGKNDAF